MREHLAGHFVSFVGRRIVQGCQGVEFLNAFFDLRGDQARVGNVFPAVNHAVAYGADFGRIGDYTHLRVGQQFGHAAKAGGVVGYFARFDVFFHACLAQELVGNAAFLLADTFHQTGRQGPAGVHVDQFVLDGRTAGV